ncbi:MAG: hypothetical protein AB8D78_09005, partial [Akkermansiaceae bacterium]
LTVVILVLLSLISILFIGARAWKKGSDRAASILQIRNVQQAVRSFSNMNGFNPGDGGTQITAKGFTSLEDELFGSGKFMENDPTDVAATHPAGTGYTYAATTAGTIPLIGTLYLEVTGTDAADYMPAPGSYNDW